MEKFGKDFLGNVQKPGTYLVLRFDFLDLESLGEEVNNPLRCRLVK